MQNFFLLIVMTFKHRRRVNTAMPANTAMPMFLPIGRPKCTYGNIADSEFLCVRVAT